MIGDPAKIPLPVDFASPANVPSGPNRCTRELPVSATYRMSRGSISMLRGALNLPGSVPLVVAPRAHVVSVHAYPRETPSTSSQSLNGTPCESGKFAEQLPSHPMCSPIYQTPASLRTVGENL